MPNSPFSIIDPTAKVSTKSFGTFLLLFLLVLSSGTTYAEGDPTKTGPAELDFTNDIRPILSGACFTCHGPDQQTREADLRLDTEEGALGDHDGHPVIIPGDAKASELIRRLTSDDADERMPPADAERQLTPEEIAKLKRWVDEGAAWQKHWSFVAPKKSDPPQVTNSDWPRGAIDRHILARLEKEGLRPSPAARRETLLRRVTLDLTGLPPTIQELDAFLADETYNAYEKVVDRLLGTPAHAERLALEWLDAARYADTHGYHVDSIREMWHWRDWVIQAFADNMPFDQFTTEQLAGDLLPNPTRAQKIATGFNRNHGINFEGGAFAEEYRVEYVVDRVHTTATVFLGLTMKCARCHDHKFDPISQKDYYQFFALFNTIGDKGIDGALGNATPMLSLPNKKQRETFHQAQARLAEVDKKIAARREAASPDLTAWVTKRHRELSAPTATKKPATVETETVVKTETAAEPATTNGAGTTGTKESAEKKEATKKPSTTPIDDLIIRTAGDFNDEQFQQVRQYYLDNVDETYKELYALRRKTDRESNRVYRSIPNAMVMQEMDKPRDTFLLMRGQFDQHGEKVSAGVPSSMPPLPEGAEANRLGLARWLTDPGHPLMPRVTVNRFWQIYFGTGIVKTSENFGSEGTLPSHPKLLDYLATRFIESGWNVRALQKEIVMSATYRQASRITAVSYERDPFNRLLARGPRFRLPAEMIRDNAMAISGLLVKKVGGPSVSPYQPKGLWDDIAFGIKTYGGLVYKQDHGDSLYRRGMYTFWKRSCPPPALNAFDAPERETCTMRRERTNTPLQALVLLNDPTFVEASRHFAERIMTEGGESTRDRIAYAYRLAMARTPTDAERTLVTAAYEAQLAAFKKDSDGAKQLLTIGESARNEKLELAEHAAWTAIARILLNLDETITKG